MTVSRKPPAKAFAFPRKMIRAKRGTYYPCKYLNDIKTIIAINDNDLNSNRASHAKNGNSMSHRRHLSSGIIRQERPCKSPARRGYDYIPKITNHENLSSKSRRWKSSMIQAHVHHAGGYDCIPKAIANTGGYEHIPKTTDTAGGFWFSISTLWAGENKKVSLCKGKFLLGWNLGNLLCTF